MNDYEKGFRDGMAGAALPNIVDNGDKIDGYTYMYKTDSDGVPFINIESVRSMLNKATEGKHGKWDGYICPECNVCADYFISGEFYFDEKPNYCPNCGARRDKS